MHNLNKNFIEVEKYYFNLNSSLKQKIKFIFFLISKSYVIHFYNNLGSKNVNKLLNFIPSSNIIFHERGSAWNAKDNDIKTYKNNSLKASVIIANSIATKILLIKRFGIDKKKIKVIYNGFLSNEDNFIPKIVNRYSKRFSVGYLGRLDTPKGVHVLIKTAKKLNNYDFFIAGVGALQKQLMELANNSDNIKFLGSLKEPLKFISKMDVIVVPSIREPFGNTIVEAGFCKKAVIASKIDGIPEIIKDKFSGILIDPDKEISFNELPSNAVTFPDFVVDPQKKKLIKPKEIDSLKLCESINFLALNSNIRNLYGNNLHKTVVEKFNIEKYYLKLDDLYRHF